MGLERRDHCSTSACFPSSDTRSDGATGPARRSGSAGRPQNSCEMAGRLATVGAAKK